MDEQDVEAGQRGERDAREVGGHAPGDAGPAVVGALDEAPQPHAGKARAQRQQQVHHQHRCQQRPARRGRQEPCARQCVDISGARPRRTGPRWLGTRMTAAVEHPLLLPLNAALAFTVCAFQHCCLQLHLTKWRLGQRKLFLVQDSQGLGAAKQSMNG